MGFETRHLQCPPKWCLIWSNPMGFETDEMQGGVYGVDIWSNPMGFETTLWHTPKQAHPYLK